MEPIGVKPEEEQQAADQTASDKFSPVCTESAPVKLSLYDQLCESKKDSGESRFLYIAQNFVQALGAIRAAVLGALKRLAGQVRHRERKDCLCKNQSTKHTKA